MAFPPASRYFNASTYQALTPDGGSVTAIVIPSPRASAPLGFHPRAVGDRLDLLATQYLNDPTGFWRLCDANNSMVAGALEVAQLIGIPGVAS